MADVHFYCRGTTVYRAVCVCTFVCACWKLEGGRENVEHNWNVNSEVTTILLVCYKTSSVNNT